METRTIQTLKQLEEKNKQIRENAGVAPQTQGGAGNAGQQHAQPQAQAGPPQQGAAPDANLNKQAAEGIANVQQALKDIIGKVDNMTSAVEEIKNSQGQQNDQGGGDNSGGNSSNSGNQSGDNAGGNSQGQAQEGKDDQQSQNSAQGSGNGGDGNSSGNNNQQGGGDKKLNNSAQFDQGVFEKVFYTANKQLLG